MGYLGSDRLTVRCAGVYRGAIVDFVASQNEPRYEKTGLRGFRPGPT